ncbi:LAFE_0F01816g1_1 [Lachancea fermentati]|uniref:LAFE_0F01816g1_1 n=1 Tax=Lachancea fermentati TaxID=4955 RepID=A0A1G4ME98_LACFM|nr:LAFE_0F01816g1_1 [Lachancea fermentati]
METDIRYSFLDTLDHLPSELIRSLWTIQGLELVSDGDATESHAFADREALKEAQHIERLLRHHSRYLRFQVGEMREMAEIKQRYEQERARRDASSPRNALPIPQAHSRAPLKIKINLKAQNPKEEVYCVCRDVSYGPMIACDNKRCPIEWFHYGCVGLVKAPKASQKWYCSDKCRRQATRR